MGTMKRVLSFLFQKGGVASACPPPINYLDPESLINFVYEWNNMFPIDHWWREKHKVAFNSHEHRSVSIFDMRFEYEEDMAYGKIRNSEIYEINKGDIYTKEALKRKKDESETLDDFLREEQDFDYSKYDD
jgi:hypothetical protein